MIQVKACPHLPSVAPAMEIRFVPSGNHIVTSNTKNAQMVITNQPATSNATEPANPSSAVATGKPKIPAPIVQPTIKSTPPISFEFIYSFNLVYLSLPSYRSHLKEILSFAHSLSSHVFYGRRGLGR